MDLMLQRALGQQLLLSFDGKQEVPSDLRQLLSRQHVGGVVLFRNRNIGSLSDLRALTAALQKAATDSKQPPLIVMTDQEGGALMAIGEGTPFPGNMALGATRSEELTERVGRALGREVAAVGVNVNLAPVCDVNNNPKNSVVGVRSFGEDPELVARLSAAMIRGMQGAGVAATAKHFPGHGDTTSDPNHQAPLIPHAMGRLRTVELPPFEAAVRAGVRLVMAGHIVLPRVTGGAAIPATLSAAILRGILRQKLGFEGLIVTDSMRMKSIAQGPGLVMDVLAALNAGADLLLMNHDELSRVEEVFAALVQAGRRGLLSAAEVKSSATRILGLKEWLRATKQPPLSVVRCAEHMELAREVADASVTLVRVAGGRVPLQLPAAAKVAVGVPRPEDLTVADTSSHVAPGLAAAVRRRHARVDDFTMSMNPSPADIQGLVERLGSYDLVILGTINACTHAGQAALVNALLDRGIKPIVIALRMPYDIAAFPAAPAYACTYGILPPSMDAVVDALWGRIPFAGQLPVALPAALSMAAP
jgi:beta-N-acetylhexosaminidase